MDGGAVGDRGPRPAARPGARVLRRPGAARGPSLRRRALRDRDRTGGVGTSRTRRVLAETAWLPAAARRAGLDVLHHPGGTIPPIRATPAIVTVHDLQPLAFPEHFSVIKRNYLRVRLGPSVRRARLVTPSASSRPPMSSPGWESTPPEWSSRHRPSTPIRRPRRSAPTPSPRLTGCHRGGSCTRRSPTPTRTMPCSCGPSPSFGRPTTTSPSSSPAPPRPRRGRSANSPSGSGSPTVSAARAGFPPTTSTVSTVARWRAPSPRGTRPSASPFWRRWPARARSSPPTHRVSGTWSAMPPMSSTPTTPRRGRRRCAGCSTTRPDARRSSPPVASACAPGRRLRRRPSRRRLAHRSPSVNLLVLCPHFSPDVAPTGEVMTAIADGLVERGHRIHVVTSLPWYRHHRVEEEWQGRPWRTETTSWGRITRVHPFPTDKTNIPARAVAFGGFTGLAATLAASTPARPDAVLAMSPPLTLGLAGWTVARLRRAPFVFNIQDVFPDVAVELGVLTNRGVIATAAWLERVTYQAADAVTVLSDDLRANVAAKIAGRRRGDPTKVRVIPNFVDTERIRPADPDNAYRREHGLTGKRVVMYAGNVGLSQSLDLVVEAARRLADRDDVVFVINGGGSALAELERSAAGLANLRFVGMQPKERLPEVLAAGDIHLVPLKRGLAKASVPSKLYSVLAAGRPVLASVDEGTEVARSVEQAGAGIAVPPDDPDAFCKALVELLDDDEGARRMGERGRRFVESRASPAAVAARYEDLFRGAAGATPAAARLEVRDRPPLALSAVPGASRARVRTHRSTEDG